MRSCLLALLVFAAVPAIGCSKSKTVTTEEVVSDADGVKDYSKVEKRTTTTESDSDIGCSGILSCTFDVLGAIIALPFRIVAGTIDLIF